MISIGLISGSVSGAWSQPSSGDPDAAFTAAYAAYQSAYESGDLTAALPAARQAYELGVARFGSLDANTGVLALNYGNVLATVGNDQDLAVEMLGEADRIFEELFGPNSMNRIQVRLSLAAARPRHDDRLEPIRAALEMQRAVAPDDEVAYAQLLSASADSLMQVRADSPDAVSMLSEALEILEAAFGRDASALVPALIALGDATARRDASDDTPDYYRRALQIAKAARPVDVEGVADLELRIGSRPTQAVNVTQRLRYLRSAHSTFSDLLGTQHEKTALAALVLAQMYSGTAQSVRAENRAQEAVEFFTGKARYADHLIQARRLLMGIYLYQADEDRFNEQLVELGRLSENFAMPDAQQPVLKYAPEYPAAAVEIRAEGYVIVEFTVDESGRVRDPFVVESSRDHGSLFHDAALDSVRRFRYIPRHVNGLPVSVDGIRNRISFLLETSR